MRYMRSMQVQMAEAESNDRVPRFVSPGRHQSPLKRERRVYGSRSVLTHYEQPFVATKRHRRDFEGKAATNLSSLAFSFSAMKDLHRFPSNSSASAIHANFLSYAHNNVLGRLGVLHLPSPREPSPRDPHEKPQPSVVVPSYES